MTTTSETTDDGEVVTELDLGPYWDKVYALEETAASLRATLIRMGGTDPRGGQQLPDDIEQLAVEMVRMAQHLQALLRHADRDYDGDEALKHVLMGLEWAVPEDVINRACRCRLVQFSRVQ